MAIEFQTIDGNMDDIISEAIKETDLIIEGGAGSNLWPCTGFKRLGYDGPYVRTDLIFFDEPFEPSRYDSQKYGITVKWWPHGGNCFLMEDMKPVVKKFESKKPLFVTNSALSNALFAKEMTPWEKKAERDRVPVSEAVSFLNKVYKKQLHIDPGLFSVASKDYVERHRNELKGIPEEEVYPNLMILNVRGSPLGMYEFKNFIEKSAKLGWNFYLPSEQKNVLYMKK